jgi:hypothetical protein
MERRNGEGRFCQNIISDGDSCEGGSYDASGTEAAPKPIRHRNAIPAMQPPLSFIKLGGSRGGEIVVKEAGRIC